MLQQTRIDTALPYFERWMAALPDFAALAAAPEDRVLKLWEGLGYYRRARNLQAIARRIVASASVPATLKEWQELPGIGPYTAAAITSIAFGEPNACVDGNVVRVLARITGFAAPIKDSASAVRLFQPIADGLLDKASPGNHNQAMMELGATACQRKAACPACPVRDFCEARRLGLQDNIPVLPSRQIEKVEVRRVWWVHQDQVLISRSGPTSGRLANLCELPRVDEIETAAGQAALDRPPLLIRKRTITRYAITESIFAVDGRPATVLPAHLFWAPLAEVETLTFSGPHRRWIRELAAVGEQPK